MRIANTLKITGHTKSEEEQKALTQALKTHVKTTPELSTLTHEEFETIYVVKLWLTKQQEIRTMLKFLSRLTTEEKNTLLTQAPQRVDERGNFFFRIDKQAFLEEKAVYQEKGDVLQIKINIAAHPKTPERVQELIRTFLHAQDVNL